MELGARPRQPIRVFSTAPQSSRVARADFLRRVKDVARWSEEGGCEGILVYTDNSLVDPWLVAQLIIGETRELCPLVAVQPIYMHPYWAAKMVATLAHLHDRRVFLNMVAGGFVGDLAALDDHTPHDPRYDRLVEYTTIIQLLLSGSDPVSFQGDYYVVDRLRIAPPVPPELRPGFFVSGSSTAGLAAAARLGATAVQYPKPAGAYLGGHEQMPPDAGIRIGIIARADAADAWRIAWERFPEDRRGRLTHELAMKVSDSVWHRQLARLAEEAKAGETPYWLHPYENYRTFCPYLVGSYDAVASAVGEYIEAGFDTFILDIPTDREELDHIGIVFERARATAHA